MSQIFTHSPRWRHSTAENSPPQFSPHSTHGVPNSAWCSTDFLVGAGMVIIQPSTQKVLLVYENKKHYWFLPKGRKDIGESLEQTALREAYEESGYRVEFLPLHTCSRAPSPHNDRSKARHLPNTEPIYITTHMFSGRRSARHRDHGGEYITSWYVGQIPEDAIHEDDTLQAGEHNYTSHLMSIGEALDKLVGTERLIVSYAWILWMHTLKMEEASGEIDVEGQENERRRM